MSDSPKLTIEEWETALVKRIAIENYSCKQCGSNSESAVVDCCDECILKFYFEESDAPSLSQFRKEEVSRYLDKEGIWRGTN